MKESTVPGWVWPLVGWAIIIGFIFLAIALDPSWNPQTGSDAGVTSCQSGDASGTGC